MTPLLLAASAGSAAECRALLKNGANINARDNFGRTALHWAAECGETECVKLLLEDGAEIEAVDDYGRNAAAHAALFRLPIPEITKLLKG